MSSRQLKQYYVKLKPEGDYWGLRGHNTSQSWQQAVDLIAERGIEKVDWVKHDDKTPRKPRRPLAGWEMLKLWKAVDSRQRDHAPVL